MIEDPRAFLGSLFGAAIRSADPATCLADHLPLPPKGRTIVVGFGKAAASMARAVEDNWSGELSGLVVTRYGHSVPTERIEVVEASHPVPDTAGVEAARRIMKLVEGLTSDDLVIALISGGGSALFSGPLAPVTLGEKQIVSKALLKSGAPISEMNCVRRHLSSVKGGRLAAACAPAKLVSLVISDVPGDDFLDIASGPTVGDPTTCADALEILERYKIDTPASVRNVLESGAGETVKPDNMAFEGNEVALIAAPQIALEAAARQAEAQGVAAHILGDAIEGEAADVGRVMAGIALQTARRGQPFTRPCILLSGGETTVTVKGKGRGGRNVEFLLSLCVALGGEKGIYALAGDTDGVDGLEEIAGAYISPETLKLAEAAGINTLARLADNDGHGFFEALGKSVVTGPTLTNVNDFRAIYIASPTTL